MLLCIYCCHGLVLQNISTWYKASGNLCRLSKMYFRSSFKRFYYARFYNSCWNARFYCSSFWNTRIHNFSSFHPKASKMPILLFLLSYFLPNLSTPSFEISDFITPPFEIDGFISSLTLAFYLAQWHIPLGCIQTAQIQKIRIIFKYIAILAASLDFWGIHVVVWSQCDAGIRGTGTVNRWKSVSNNFFKIKGKLYN